jgi:hypothetical protein
MNGHDAHEHTRVDGTSPADLERLIGQQREELAKTIDALQAKFDVKTRARHQLEEIRRHPQWLGAAAVAAAAVVALVVWRRLR